MLKKLLFCILFALVILGAAGAVYAAESDDVVVMLDPGHDATHAGAQANSISEEELVLKIGLYCREALEQYPGITVCMTRETEECPHTGTTSNKDNTLRVDDAYASGASYYVSLHLNSADSTTASGAEVYYPNANGDAQVGAAGKALAAAIQEKLVALGLNDRGIKYKNSQVGDSFADGTLMDYYTVIRKAKTYGIAAVIVEHAFVSSATDVEGFLNTDAKLKLLAEADAEGIAQALGLEKGISITAIKSPDPSKAKLTWSTLSAATKYVVYRSGEKNGEYTQVAETDSGTYTDKGLSDSTRYYYKVKAYAGDELISTSGAVYVDTLSDSYLNNITSDSDGESITVSWNADENAGKYLLYRSTDGTSFTRIASLSSGVTSYTDTSRKRGVVYYYKLRTAISDSKRTAYGRYSEIYSSICVKKASITGVKGTADKGITVSWNAVELATGYRVLRSTSKDGTYSVVGKVSGADVLSYTDTSVPKNNTVYYYKVCAVSKYTKTNQGILSAAVPGQALAAPEIKSVSVKSGGVTIKWESVTGAKKYVIKRSTNMNSGYKKLVAVRNTTSYTDWTVEDGVVYYYKVIARAKISGVVNTSPSEVCSTVSVDAPEIAVLECTEDGVVLDVNPVSGADGYEIERSKGDENSYSTIAETYAGESISLLDTEVEEAVLYYYRVRAYMTYNGEKIYSNYSTSKSVVSGYEIMGDSTASLAQMVSYYASKGRQYPSDVYSDLGASTIEEFCVILIEEAYTEGVRAEVVFAQVMLETGYLQFGGDVEASQCNFAGLGATGNGVSGESFSDVREGLRAQVQHLKAYASEDDLVNECVDTRFKYVTRGCAPYVQWLAIPDNPSGKGWASTAGYGDKLLKIIDQVKDF